MKIAFFDRQLCERGTTVALFDYAFFNEKYLKNQSIIIYLNNPPKEPNSNDVVSKFKNYFTIYGINKNEDIDDIIRKEDCQYFYQISLDVRTHYFSKIAKNICHAVLDCSNPRPYLHKIATISKDVFHWNESIHVVPHMIHLPNHNLCLRKKLNISKDATVFGRYGGKTEFNNSAVHYKICEIALNYKNIYFIFVNTNNFLSENFKKMNLKNIIFLPTIKDEYPQNTKVKFINTCDAMIWGRQCGEAFGIALGEFNVFNKPIICSITRRHNAHISILGKKGLYYHNCYGDNNLDNKLPLKVRELKEIILDFHKNKEEYKNKNWKAYDEFTPEKVMDIFQSTFLS